MPFVLQDFKICVHKLTHSTSKCTVSVSFFLNLTVKWVNCAHSPVKMWKTGSDSIDSDFTCDFSTIHLYMNFISFTLSRRWSRQPVNMMLYQPLPSLCLCSAGCSAQPSQRWTHGGWRTFLTCQSTSRCVPTTTGRSGGRTTCSPFASPGCSRMSIAASSPRSWHACIPAPSSGANLQNTLVTYESLQNAVMELYGNSPPENNAPLTRFYRIKNLWTHCQYSLIVIFVKMDGCVHLMCWLVDITTLNMMFVELGRPSW